MWKGQQKTDLPCLPGVPRGGCRKTGGLCDIIVAEVLALPMGKEWISIAFHDSGSGITALKNETYTMTYS